MAQGAVHLAVLCPRCGTTNTLTIAHVRDDERVSCSHCGAEIGRVAELKSQSSSQKPPAHVAPPPG